ncbi:MAG: radical SAM protein [Bacteroidales bacterium]|nr:radical SAM protein [Bacteroidales bacterium]
MNRLYHQLVFGPVHSRRLGKSLGINIVLPQHKFCNFNCIYCECGLSDVSVPDKFAFPTVTEMAQILEERLSFLKKKGESIDSITFSGNGEPTLHPDFLEIVKAVKRIRQIYYPEAKISVLSNSTMLHKSEVKEALSLIENPILKLDAPTPELFYEINQPSSGIDFKSIVHHLKSLTFPFYLQTIFLEYQKENGVVIKNYDTHILEKWFTLIDKFFLKGWMIYPVDRPTPYLGIRKLTPDEMGQIYQFLATQIQVPIMINY